MTAPRVAVIVVAHNGGASLEACLVALRAGTYAPLDIVLVDNASSDGSIEPCRGRADLVLANASNLGFAGGVNAGIADYERSGARVEVYALVNQDCVVDRAWLAPLVARLGAEPRVAVVGARIYEPDGRTLQHAGARIAANGLTEHVGRGVVDPGAHRQPLDVDYVTGAVCAFRRETWARHGPFDERYFPAYFEEVDFCTRCRADGLRVVYEPASEAVHAEASVLGRNSPRYLRAYHASRMRYAVAHLLVRGKALAALRAEAAWLVRRRSIDEVRPALAAYGTLPRLLLETRRTRGRAVA